MRHGPDGSTVIIRLRVAGTLLLVAHLLYVGWLTLRPLDVPWVTAPNFHPLAGIRADMALGTLPAARRIGEALLLLAPLGVLLPMVGGRIAVSPLGSLARSVAAGALFSLAIELLQTGVPGQVVDVDSLLLNTVGVGLAHLAVVPAGRSLLRRRRRRARPRGRALLRDDVSQGATPTIPRVGIAP
ncbi:VanZ family protein [Streptomyces sp. 21So2-11]|uniref:VanZ family protein n=1 Tax=Streptomyces sp. 21So2-11 TaxID=3144408 RepID=UPI00321BA05D